MGFMGIRRFRGELSVRRKARLVLGEKVERTMLIDRWRQQTCTDIRVLVMRVRCLGGGGSEVK